MNGGMKELLSSLYELEGLVLLVDNHKQDTNAYVFDIIKEKASKINELAQEMDISMFEDDSPVIESAPDDTALEEDVNTDNIEEDTVYDDDFIAKIQNSHEEECDSQHALYDSEVMEDSEIEAKFANIADNNEGDTTYFDTTVGDVPEANDVDCDEVYNAPDNVENSDSENEEDSEDNTIEEDEEYDEADEYDDIEDSDDYEDEDVIRVEDILQHDKSKNLRRAFTLNDRFRFRRELFANSDVEMNNTLDMIEIMQTYGEAEDYVYDDLQWDKDSPEVSEFMKIIRSHFS